MGVEKDSQNIDYLAKVGAVGTTFRFALGKNAVWNTTAVASEQISNEKRNIFSTSP